MSHPAFVSPTERITLALADGVLRVGFNNPARHNAFSMDMWQAIPPILEQAARDDAVRVIVFTGEGGKAFASGADISQFETLRSGEEAVRLYESAAENALMGIHRSAKPTIAAIRGYCIGGGVNIAISCDLRLASSESQFAIPAIRLGLGYRFSAMKNLVDLVGPGAAKEIFFTAKRFKADEAQALGLITRSVPAEDLDALLAEYAGAIAAGAPLTLQAGKQIIDECMKSSSEIDMALCEKLIADCFASEDYSEGRKAFMEKRTPAFKGR
jgi:enoyl-CoA hydratase/carnithine racemase